MNAAQADLQDIPLSELAALDQGLLSRRVLGALAGDGVPVAAFQSSI